MSTINYTHRTRHGMKARILCTDFKDARYAVVVVVLREDGHEVVHLYTEDLRYAGPYGEPHDYDLVAYSPWQDVVVDTPIWVKEYPYDDWDTRHFAKYHNGIVYAWSNGCTSHSTEHTTPWECASLTKPDR